MKQLCSLLLGSVIFVSMHAGSPQVISWATRFNKPANANSLFEEAQKQFDAGSFDRAATSFERILDWNFDAQTNQQAAKQFVDSLGKQIVMAHYHKEAQLPDSAKINKAVGLLAEYAATTRCCWSGTPELYHFAAPEQQECLLSSLPQQECNALAHQYEQYGYLPFALALRKSAVNDKEHCDTTAHIAYAQNVLHQVLSPNLSPDAAAVAQAQKRLSAVCQQNAPKPEDLSTAWNLQGDFHLTQNKELDAMQAYLNALITSYNSYEDYAFPAHLPHQLANIATLAKNNPTCKAELDAVVAEMEPEQKPEFLKQLYTHAADYGSPEGAWLLAQHEQEQGNFQAAQELYQKLASNGYPKAQEAYENATEMREIQAFGEDWQRYSQSSEPDAALKAILESTIVKRMHDQNGRTKLLHIKQDDSALSTFVWQTIFNKAKDRLRFEAAYELAKLTPATAKKELFFNMAVTNGITEAHKDALAFCQANPNNSEKLLKTIADENNIDAQLAYALRYRGAYTACSDKTTPEAKQLNKVAMHYFGKVTQHAHKDKTYENRHIEALCYLSVIAHEEGKYQKAVEILTDAAESGHPNAQFQLAYFHRLQAVVEMNVPSPASRSKKGPHIDPVKQAIDAAEKWYEIATNNKACPAEKRYQGRCDLACMYGDFANAYDVLALGTAQEKQKKKYQELAHTYRLQKRMHLERLQKDSACPKEQKVRILTELSTIEEEAGNRQMAVDLTMQACKLDRAYSAAYGNGAALLSRMLQQIMHEKKADAQREASLGGLEKALVESFTNRELHMDIYPQDHNAKTIEHLMHQAYSNDQKIFEEILKSIEGTEQLYEKLSQIIEQKIDLIVQKAPTVLPSNPNVSIPLESTPDNKSSSITLDSLNHDHIIEAAQRWVNLTQELVDAAQKRTSQLASIKKHAEELRALNKNAPGIATVIGICSSEEGNFKKAARFFAEDTKHNYALACYNLGKLYIEGKLDRSLELPGHGMVASKISLETSVELFRMTIAIDPTFHEAYMCLAGALRQMGQDLDALEQYDQCFKVTGQLDILERKGRGLLLGYGGVYNVVEALSVFAKVHERYNKTQKTEHAKQMLQTIELGMYLTPDYVQNRASDEGESIFASKATIEESIRFARKQIRNGLEKQRSLVHTNAYQQEMQRPLELLEKALNAQTEEGKEAAYEDARIAYIQALETIHFNESVENITAICNGQALDITKSLAHLALGALNASRAYNTRDMDKKIHYCREARKQCAWKIEALDPLSLDAPCRMYQHALSIIPTIGGLKSYAKYSEQQKNDLEIAKDALKKITSEYARYQPHNYFVGQAYVYLSRMYLQVFNDKTEAEAFLKEGAAHGHSCCLLALARYYESGKFNAEEAAEIEKAKECLEQYLPTIQPNSKENKPLQTCKRDLMIHKHNLGIVDEHADDTTAGITTFYLRAYTAFIEDLKEQTYDRHKAWYTVWLELDRETKLATLQTLRLPLPRNSNLYKMQEIYKSAFPDLKNRAVTKQIEWFDTSAEIWAKMSIEEQKNIPINPAMRDEIYKKINVDDIDF